MKRLVFPLGLLLAVSAIVNAQERTLVPFEKPVIQSTGSYAIPGCRVLQLEEQKLAAYIKQHPEALQEQRLHKHTAWNFTVGSKGPINGTSWWATDITTNVEYLVPATCRAVGNNCYIFVEDVLWNNGRATQVAVDSIRNNWDFRTPAFPSKGIYQVDTETYGFPKDVDSDSKIIILILDIKDGFSGSGGYVAGYFFSINEFPDGSSAIGSHRSNFAEIYYIDGNPTNLNTSNGVTLAMQTAAHEFQHMIHYNYDPSEITFVNEACSQVAELVNGYPFPDQGRYTDNTDIYLLGWSSSLEDYSRAERFMLYMWNQFPNNYLKLLVQNTGTGITGIDNALAAYSPTTSRRFSDLFVDWEIANILNDASVNSRYAYTYASSLTKPKATTYINPNTGSQIGSVNSLAADYITFSGGTNLSISFNSTSPSLVVKAIKVGASTKQVVDVPLNSQVTEPAFGTTFTSITYVVINTSQSLNATYSYQATGTSVAQSFEIKYDDGQPEGFLNLTPGDIILVYFTGVQGAKLDSLRIAFRRMGTIQTTVSRFNNSFNPSPIGQTLVPTFGLVSKDTILNYTPPGPYPVPYPNWVKVDLRSFNIDASTDFAVSFVVNSTPSAPAVMISSEPDNGEYHSFTYSQSLERWLVYTDANNAENVFRYIVRAYVSTGTTTSVEQVIELQPKSYSLQQNYPNPFNPSTTIRYDLPEKSFVRLDVVDMLGRIVTTLVDEEKPAGSYQSIWNGNTATGIPAPTGVYFYRLESGSYRSIKKMVMLK
jgi:hypothetical protein